MRFDQALTVMLTHGNDIYRIGSDDFYSVDDGEDIPVIWHYDAEDDELKHAVFSHEDVLASDWEIKS